MVVNYDLHSFLPCQIFTVPTFSTFIILISLHQYFLEGVLTLPVLASQE